MTDKIGYARSGAAILEFSGPGAVACLQGLVSSDIEKAGENSVTYGAVLTPKGMIIADGWIIRAGERLFMVTEQSARVALLEVFRKALPPRLARVTDRSEAWSIMRVFGAREEARGHVRVDGDTITARLPASAWFDELRLGPAEADGALQDVFLLALRYEATYDPGRGLHEPWLWAIARHVAAARLHGQGRRAAHAVRALRTVRSGRRARCSGLPGDSRRSRRSRSSLSSRSSSASRMRAR